MSALPEAGLGLPSVREGTVARPALVERLRPNAHAAVAAVVAPAGYGKTTLLAEAAAGGDLPFLWSAIGSGHDDPETLAASLPAGDPVRVVLDDVHLLGVRRAEALIRTLARSLPQRGQLLVSSRVPLDLDGVPHLVEIGTDDLRLTAAETSLLLARAGVTADDGESEALAERLEGWPAGIYLAALAHLSDGQPLASFTGADRYAAGYLRDECLAGLADADIAFLTRCAALERLSGPLCNAALRTSRSAARLARLAQATLFIRRTEGSYRLHRALRDALLNDLRRHQPGEAEAISARAADWLESRGELEAAVPYAWAAGQTARFAGLVERAGPALYQAGRLTTVEEWLRLAPDDLLAGHPGLALWNAFLHALRGQADDALRLAEIGSQAPAGTHTPGLTLLQASMCRSGLQQMAADASSACDTPARSTALLLLGVARALTDDPEGAADALAQATVATEPVTSSLALAERAVLAANAGDWDGAEVLASRARTLVQEHGFDGYPQSALTFAISARTAVARSDWIRARADAAQAEQLAPQLTGAIPWLAVQVRLTLAGVRLELSEHDAAAALLGEAEALIAGSAGLGALAERAAELRRELTRGDGRGTGSATLTPAEQRLLPLLATHLSFREIADVVGVSRNTVKTQAICVYRKLGVSSRSGAIERAGELGLVERPDALVRPRARA